MENEAKIWSWLKSHTGLNDYAVAAICGNIAAESDGIPNNVENRCPYSDAIYTASVDDGSYGYWETDAYGYGLCQWTYYTRKRALKAYAKAQGKSIGDLEMQLEFMVAEMQSDYKSTWQALLSAANIATPCAKVCEDYERPANASAQAAKRYDYAAAIYERQHGCTSDTAEAAAGGKESPDGSGVSADIINRLTDVISELKAILEELA